MADLPADEIAQLEQIVVTLRRRLGALELQRARLGEHTPPHIILEIEDSKRELVQRWANLRRLRPSPDGERAPYQPLGHSLAGHTSMVMNVAFNPHGSLLASASYDGTIRLWNFKTHQPLGDPLQGHTDWVYSVCSARTAPPWPRPAAIALSACGM